MRLHEIDVRSGAINRRLFYMSKYRDEGPSAEDLRRYGVNAPNAEDAVVYCPDCAAKMHPSADICPKCFCFVSGARLYKHPWKERAKKGRATLIIALLLFALLLPFIAWLRWW